MKDQSNRSGVSGRKFAAGTTLGEAVLVATLGAAFAFAANWISPRGLALTRDYFPSGIANQVRPVANPTPPPATSTNIGRLSAAEFLAEQMRKIGLQLIDGRQALQFFRDPRRQQDLIVFVDARNEKEYQQGHIPGAYEVDSIDVRNHPENYSATVMVCLQAAQVVVYCNGGDCDESESTAITLRKDWGIANQKLFVFAGGFTEWRTNNLPVETGVRNSGILFHPNAATNATSLPDPNK